MQISARNQLEGIIREINEGPINSEITIEVAPEIMVTAQITTSSVRRLQLTVGKKAYAIIKADSVMVGIDRYLSYRKKVWFSIPFFMTSGQHQPD